MFYNAGTAVKDTSSVVATGYAFSEGAGDFATMVKLTRTLANNKNGSELKANFSIAKIFPWFILGFLAMSIVASVFPIPAAVVSGTKSVSKFLMVCALAAIGLNTSFSNGLPDLSTGQIRQFSCFQGKNGPKY